MKSSHLFVIIPLIAGLFLALLLFRPPTVKPGEVWVSHSSINPFKDVLVTNVVLDVSNGFVEFAEPYHAIENGHWRQIYSCSVDSFTSRSERIASNPSMLELP